jgi:hypothetical protein
MKKLLMLVTVLLVVSPVIAQDTLWTEIHKPDANDYSDYAYDGCVTSDGKFVMVGYTTSFEIWVGDCYLMKLDTEGDTVWTGTYGSPYRDYGYDIVETTDKGLAAVGYGRIINDTEEYRVRLYKTDSLGNLLWEEYYTNPTGCNTYGIVETTDKGFGIVGYTGTYGNYDMFLLRTDSLGDSLWFKTYGGDLNDKANSVTITDDDGFIIAGSTESYGAGKDDFYIYKVDSQGDSVWAKTYGDTTIDAAYSIERSSDGNFMIVGTYIYTDPVLQGRLCLMKMQDNGDTLWSTSAFAGNNSRGYGVCEAIDGGYIAVGAANFNMISNEVYIVRFNSDGDSLWAAAYGGPAADEGRFVHQADDSYIYVGASYATSSYPDYYFLKLSDNYVSVELVDEMIIPNSLRLDQNWPNPFNAATRIEYATSRSGHVVLEIYNVLGQKVKTLVDKIQPVGKYSVDWDGTDKYGQVVASGVYFYQVQTNDEIETRKMILMK